MLIGFVKRISFALCLLLTFSAYSFSQESIGKNREIKYIFYITFDSFRGDAYSFINPELNYKTPHIDQFAKEGIVFTDAHSPAPWTQPSFSSIMSGISPVEVFNFHRMAVLSKNYKTLSEHLKEEGYGTFAYVQNWNLTEVSQMNQGFDIYQVVDHLDSRGENFKNYYNNLLESSIALAAQEVGEENYTEEHGKDFFLERFDFIQVPDDSSGNPHSYAMKELEKRIKEDQLDDLFLWMHFIDPHARYIPPTKYLPKNLKKPEEMHHIFDEVQEVNENKWILNDEQKEWVRGLYDGQIQFSDQMFGEFINFLKENDLYDQSLIIFSSDHGEEFWEHGHLEHGWSHHHYQTHIPLIFKFPQSLQLDHKLVDHRISVQALLNTLLDYVAGETLDEEIFMGSLKPLIENSSDAQYIDKPIFQFGVYHQDYMVTVTFNGFKYTRYLDHGSELLYNIQEDPYDKNNLLASRTIPDQALWNQLVELRDIFDQNVDAMYEYHREIDAQKQAIKAQGELAERLKSLGYIQ